MQKLKFTRLAENDLLAVVEYIAQDNPQAAYEVHAAIIDTCELVSKQPNIAPIIQSSIEGLRRAVVKAFPSYIIYYRQMGNNIEIVRLGEGHRDWTTILDS